MDDWQCGQRFLDKKEDGEIVINAVDTGNRKVDRTEVTIDSAVCSSWRQCEQAKK